MIVFPFAQKSMSTQEERLELDEIVQFKKKNSKLGIFIPILLVADSANSVRFSEIAEYLHVGVDAFCLDDPIMLGGSINGLIRVKNQFSMLSAEIGKLRAFNERLAKSTITDELTLLYNMRYFKRRLNQEYLRATRYQKLLSVILFDLDFFKGVNDKSDHIMGNYVLQEVGKIVRESIRSVDIGARFGGDEYVVLLPETGRESARIMAERIEKSIREAIFDNGTHSVSITASIGVATWSTEVAKDLSTPVDLVRRGDRCLYFAKASGRGRVVDRLPDDK
jgi:diguanylate cyclase (GGDEF)-like protein